MCRKGMFQFISLMMFVCSITILNVVAEEYDECDLTIENYVVNGKYFAKISYIFNVDGPCCNYECYNQQGYATCLKKRQYKKYGIPKSAEGACLLSTETDEFVIYIGYDKNYETVMFKKRLNSSNSKEKFLKTLCLDKTEYD